MTVPAQVIHVEMVRAYGTLLGLVMKRGLALQNVKVRAHPGQVV